jgi:parvulin-like peptidyl-prolyl isomerase
VSEPVKTQFGYHIIQPLAAVKAGSVTPLSQVQDQIRTQLVSQKKNDAVNDWVANVEKEYKGKVQYAVGFEPPDTSTTTGETTTSGG